MLVRNGKPLIVPFTATRARVPHTSGTLKGTAMKHHAPPGPAPTAFALNFFCITVLGGEPEKAPKLYRDVVLGSSGARHCLPWGIYDAISSFCEVLGRCLTRSHNSPARNI